MIDQKKIIAGLIVSGVIALLGFYTDFQYLKAQVYAVENKVKSINQELTKLDTIKEIQCEVAIELFQRHNKNTEKILKHCR